MSRHAEKCQNPWKSDCPTAPTEVYIMYKGELLPICPDCWQTIADLNYEWKDE